MSATSQSTRTVLIVDDEDLIRVVLSDLFEDAGFSVREASTGDEAISVLLGEASCIDLLLTDVRMPGDTDGLALALWARKNRPNAKVVIMSGYAGEHGRVAAHAYDAFIPKPFNPPHVVGLARRLIGPEGHQPSLA